MIYLAALFLIYHFTFVVCVTYLCGKIGERDRKIIELENEIENLEERK